MAADHRFSDLFTKRLSRRRLVAAGAATLGALAGSSLLAACGGDDDDDDDVPTGAATATSAATTGATTAASTPAPGATATLATGPTATTASTTGQPTPGGTLVIADETDADVIDPHRHLAGIAADVAIDVTERVIALTTDLELEPILLTSIEVSDDGLIYTMNVREGIKFHDGTDLTAESIAFSHDRANNEMAAYPGQFYGATWEVIDPLTVNMIMPEPNSGVMLILAFSGCGIIPVTEDGPLGANIENPVGSGPYMFVEWIPGDHATIVAYDGYQNFHSWAENKGRPYIDEVIYRIILEEQTQIAAFETGEAHLVDMPALQVAKFEGNEDYVLLRNEQSTTTAYLAPVILEQPDGTYDWLAPFNELQVRQAMGWAINVDEIIEGVLGGLAVRNRSTLPAGNPGYTDRFQEMGFDYDPEMAKQLLDEAGWVEGSGGVREKDGEKLSIVLWTYIGANDQRVGQLIQNHLQQVGFEVALESLETATLLDRQFSGDVHIMQRAYNWNDPDIVWWLGSDTSLPSGLYGKLNPEFDEIGTQGWSVTELSDRAEFYYQAAKIMVEDGAMIPLWNPVLVDGVRAEVKNFKHAAQGRRIIVDAYFEGS